jgi:iron complex transport system substrate-binding protein
VSKLKKFNFKLLNIFLIMMILTVVWSTGCTKKQSNQTQSIQSTKKTITDMTGRKVTIPLHVNRVAISGTAMTQLAVMLGGNSKIVATVPSIKSNPWYMKIYPKIKTVSVPFDKEVNIEELIKSKPDVVVLWSGKEELQKKIEKLGIPVIIIYYDTPEELKKSVTLMGNLLGDKETKKAAEFCSYYDSNIKRITEKTSSISADNKVKVYYSAESPLSTDGNNSIVTSWIEMSGGINLAAQNGITGMSQNVPMEDVVKWNPDVIVVRDAPNKDAILKDVRFKDINAVKNNKIYINPKGVNVWCARSGDEALQVLWAAKILHPDMFEDIDMNKEVKEFYKTYYSYDVSNEELEDIMNPKK